MPGKMARSAAHPPFRAVHVAAAVRATRLPCQNAGKAQKFALVRRSIWGIPANMKFRTSERRRNGPMGLGSLRCQLVCALLIR
jgi:hypothetical protein